MDRIYFAENPWPNGHRIASFEWSAHFEIGNIAKPGLYFDFHLETADYDEEDLDVDDKEDEEEAEDEWHAKIVWNNYHSCILSSTQWGDTGFLAGTDLKPFDLESLDGKEYRIDFLTSDEQENLDQDTTSFGIYLLGHDVSGISHD